MNIRYFSGEPWEESYIRAKLPDENIVFHKGSLESFPDLNDPDTEVLCTFIESHIGKDELDRFPGVKIIATRSTGFDHIDLEATKARGIVVTNVPSYGENTVAEFTFALILALSRRVIDADERVRDGIFSPKGLRGFDLAGKTIGVIGCGHIGSHVIRMANGFDMKVVGFEVHPDEAHAKELNFTYLPLQELLGSADIITLHVPYNPHTHHLINKENVDSLKKGSYIINTSRGAVIETDALVDALKKGILAGAALDVLEEEGELKEELTLLTAPHPKEEVLHTVLENHYLINHPRVIVTPHLAFNTTEAIERILDTTVENIQHFSKGTPINIVS